MSNHKMIPKRTIKAFVNAALWGDFETCVDFLRGTDVYSVKILDRDEVLRLKLAPKSQWNDQGIPVDTQLYEFQGASALMIAAANGHIRLVSLLLELGANPSLRDVRGRHALMYAAQSGQLHVVSFLLDWHCEAAILTPRTLQRRIIRGDAGNAAGQAPGEEGKEEGKEPAENDGLAPLSPVTAPTKKRSPPSTNWIDSPRSTKKRTNAFSPMKLKSHALSPHRLAPIISPGSPGGVGGAAGGAAETPRRQPRPKNETLPQHAR